MTNYKQISYWSLVLGLIGTALVLLFIPSEKRDLMTYVGVIGTFASVFGVIFALFQILSIKKTTSAIQAEVNKSAHRYNTLFSVSDLGKSKKVIEEIQLYIQNDNYHGSILRLKDLKETLIQNRFNADLKKWTETKEYKNLLVNIGINLNTLNDYFLGLKDATLNKALIINDLENIRTKIIEFENELKFNCHDTN